MPESKQHPHSLPAISTLRSNNCHTIISVPSIWVDSIRIPRQVKQQAEGGEYVCHVQSTSNLVVDLSNGIGNLSHQSTLHLPSDPAALNPGIGPVNISFNTPRRVNI